MKGYAQIPTKHKTLDRVSFTPRDIRNTQASGHAVTDLRVTLDTRECFIETSKQKNEAFTLRFNENRIFLKLLLYSSILGSYRTRTYSVRKSYRQDFSTGYITFTIENSEVNMMLKRSKYSPPFKFYKEAQNWANKQSFDDVWFLIYNYEAEVYQLVNDSRLHYLQHCWDLDMKIIETWE